MSITECAKMASLLGTQYPPLSLSSNRKFCRKKKTTKTKIVTMASLRESDHSEESSFPKRRAFLLLGVSVLPLLDLKSIAAEIPANEFQVVSRQSGFATIFVSPRNRNKELKSKSPDVAQDQVPEVSENNGTSIQEVQKPKETNQEIVSEDLEQSEMQASIQEAPMISSPVNGTPGISFVSLLNVIGIIGTGVLYALYATSQKEKSDMESAIKSMKMKLSEKEEATAVMKSDFEKRLLNEQDERKKQVRRLEEEIASMSSQLGSANGRIAALGGELQDKNKFLEESKVLVTQLDSALKEAREEKYLLEAKLKEKKDAIDVQQNKVKLLSSVVDDKEKSIESLEVLLSKKNQECQHLSSTVEQTRASHLEAKSTVEQLNEEILKIRNEVHLKQHSIANLEAKVRSLEEESTGKSKMIDDLTKEYNDFKLFSEERSISDSESLSMKDGELRQLGERLDFALSDARNKQVTISKLEKERDALKVLLEKEVSNLKELKEEIRTTEERLGASELEASDMAKELNETKKSYEVLMNKISKLQEEYHEANKVLVNNLEEAKNSSEALSSELVSTKEVLERTKEKLSSTSIELKEMMEDREILKKELSEFHKKMDLVAQDLKAEKTNVTTLNKELDTIGKQMLKDSEARRALEGDLDEATKSLDEMNKSALLLSKELEICNSRIASFEAEKEMLLQSVTKYKDKAQEMQESFEDAQNLITRLGSDRESFERRAKKLEEELASTKGEILRLRKQISLSKESFQDHRPKTAEVVSATTKKTVTKRRKGGSSS